MPKHKPVRWSAKAIEEKLRNAPLIVLTAVVSLTLEVFGWAYILIIYFAPHAAKSRT